MVLITYDVSCGDSGSSLRMRQLANACLNYGVRVQYSVFECDLDPAQWRRLRSQLLSIYNPDTDSLRFYMLGKSWRNRMEHHGTKPVVDLFKDPLII